VHPAWPGWWSLARRWQARLDEMEGHGRDYINSH
jgi:hypothetical protein